MKQLPPPYIPNLKNLDKELTYAINKSSSLDELIRSHETKIVLKSKGSAKLSLGNWDQAF